MVLVMVDIFPDHVAVPIDLLDQSALGGHAFGPFRRAQRPEQVAVLQQVGVVARWVGQIPLVNRLAFHVDDIDLLLAGRRIKREARRRPVPVVM